MKKETLFRGGFYLAGIMILAMGVTLSTLTEMGVTPITAPAYALSTAISTTFPRTVFVQYVLMVVLEFLIKGKERQWRDLLQIPFSVVFSAFLGWFGALFAVECGLLWQRLALLAVATVCISVGASMMVAMRLVTNPADALYMAMSRRWNKDPGLMKNVLDFLCVFLAAVIDLLAGGKLVSVGFGTVAAMILVGRIVYLFNRLFRKKLMTLAGLVP